MPLQAAVVSASELLAAAIARSDTELAICEVAPRTATPVEAVASLSVAADPISLATCVTGPDAPEQSAQMPRIVINEPERFRNHEVTFGKKKLALCSQPAELAFADGFAAAFAATFAAAFAPGSFGTAFCNCDTSC